MGSGIYRNGKFYGGTFDYNELKNKPEIPEEVIVDDELSTTSENPVQNKVVTAALSSKADVATTAKTFKIADLYDATSGIYAVGDTCVESGILYICKVPISAAESFDSSKWDAVTNTAGLFYIQPITTAAHTALLTKDPYTYYAIF